MTSKDNKFGKKKSGNKFNREKTFASSEADILRADKKQEQYNEERQNERHQRRVIAGLDKDKVNLSTNSSIFLMYSFNFLTVSMTSCFISLY